MTHSQLTELTDSIGRLLSGPLSPSGQFWVFVAIGGASLIVSIAGWYYSRCAYREASDAKAAAKEAANCTKAYIDANVLAEAQQKLARLHAEMSYQEVSSLLNDTSVPIFRMLATFEGLHTPPGIQEAIVQVRDAHAEVHRALGEVAPFQRETKTTKDAVYCAIVPFFSNYRMSLAELHGQLDIITIAALVGDSHVTK